jgi:hypothetical protein
LCIVKERPDISAAVAAGLAYKSGFEIRQPDIVRPAFSTHRHRMPASIVATINQQLAKARRSHLAEGDLEGALGG